MSTFQKQLAAWEAKKNQICEGRLYLLESENGFFGGYGATGDQIWRKDALAAYKFGSMEAALEASKNVGGEPVALEGVSCWSYMFALWNEGKKYPQWLKDWSSEVTELEVPIVEAKRAFALDIVRAAFQWEKQLIAKKEKELGQIDWSHKWRCGDIWVGICDREVHYKMEVVSIPGVWSDTGSKELEKIIQENEFFQKELGGFELDNSKVGSRGRYSLDKQSYSKIVCARPQETQDIVLGELFI